MKKLTLLHFAKDEDEFLTVPAHTLLGVDNHSATALRVAFQEEDGTADAVSVLLTVDTTNSSLKEACEVLASALAGQSRSLTTVADSVKGKFLYPFTACTSIS